MPIDLYYMNLSPASRTVLITAKHLGIEVNIKVIDLLKGEHLTEDYLKLNPAHTVPTIVDEDLVLWESRAIIQYLCNQYAPESSLYPSDPKKRALVDKMLNFDMTYNKALHDVIVSEYKGLEATEKERTDYKNKLKLMDTLIGDNAYVAGEELTIADLSIAQTTTYLAINEFKELDDYPNLKAWLERIQTESAHFKEVSESAAEDVKNVLAAKKAEQQ